jgi:hypothetical protein
MWAISSELTPDYENDIDRVPAGSGGKWNRHLRGSSKDRKTHPAGDRFRTSTMTASMKSIIRKEDEDEVKTIT